MTIVYVSNTRFPTEKAHGIALAKLCEAFADEGAEVHVVVPRVRNAIKDDPYSFYGVQKNFSVTYLPTVDVYLFGLFKPVFFAVQLFSFSIAAFFYCRRYEGKRAIFFSHDYIPLCFLTFLPNHIIYDIHHFPGNNFLYRRVMKKAALFPVQTKWKVEELSKQFGIPKERIPYWPNGVDAEHFEVKETTKEAKRALKLSPEPLALYIGQLFPWKGADTFVRSIAHVRSNVRYAIVGGEEADRVRIRKNIPESNDPRISFYPFQPRKRIPLWLKAADVLVLPNTGTMKVSLYYTSPMKLFEYMAAGKPIVSSDIPSVREIVSEQEVFFATPDDPL
ncbi:MAG: glycosyltransferase family 4 protein, partial [bacterium]|nr:glycosyltransferase family 4 protein [bacterium]